MAALDYVMSAGTAAYYAVVIIIVLLVVGFGGFFVFRLLQYNKVVVVRVVTSGTELIIKDVAREYKDKKSGVYLWRLRKRRHTMPRPHPRAIKITKRGKEWSDVFYTGQGQYVPIATSSLDLSDKKEFVEGFQPITESQRMAYADLMQKAQSWKSKSIHDLVAIAVPYMAAIMIVAVFLLFLGEGMKPIIAQASIANQGAADMKEAMAISKEVAQLLRGVQVVGGEPIMVQPKPVFTNDTFVPPD